MTALGNELTVNGYTFDAMVAEAGAIAGLTLVSAVVLAKWGMRIFQWFIGRLPRIFGRA